MNQVPSSPPSPEATGDASVEVAAAPVRTENTGSSMMSQRLAPFQIKPIASVADSDPMPSETEELQAQLQESRQSIIQWTRAEAGWNGQRRLFKLMTENVSDIIAVVDGKGNRVWNNSIYRDLLGYPSDQLAGTHVLNEAHPEDKARAAAALNQAQQKGATQPAEFRVKRQDGGWLDLQARFVPLRDASGRVDAVVFVAHDVTEKKRLGEALALASTDSTAAGVIENMTRDLDQIITGAVGSLSIAKSLNGAQNTLAVRLNEVERALQKARDLIEQLNAVSGHPDRARVRVNLEPLVQEVVNGVFRGTMVRAEYLFPRRLPEPELDMEAFSHALRAIVTNSVQAMDKGVVRVTAEFLSADQIARNPSLALKHGSYIHVGIQDQGRGMSERTLAHAFEPYFTTRPGAQGLGLTTAMSALQRLGGTITADSTPGVGTTIHIYLPASASSTPSSVPGLTTPTTLAESSAPKRILLMDDEQMILDIVSRMLSHLGYDVKVAPDGAQAIAAYTKAKNQGEPFDVVIMDLIIPKGIGGQDAVYTIRKIDPHAKVIASSGHLDHPVMMEHKKFGFVAALEKPYKLDRLQQVIQAVIETNA